MLFNSYDFILGFLPVTLLVFYALGARGFTALALGWLTGASLCFYAWWNPVYLGLLLVTLVVNFGLGRLVAPDLGLARRRWLLILGILFNLGLLGYFKYANFFIDTLGRAAGTGWTLESILLPLGISFFTFQQLAYLVDSYRGEVCEHGFLHYCLFVTFFPQLIAGPIVHHREMLPQFRDPDTFRFSDEKVAVGLTLFAIGLFKKVVLADGMAAFATPAFTAVAAGTPLSFFEAWGATWAYTLQLYFDFSGYSDMAVGLARLCGMRLPINFHSPYQAVSVIDFWRRWHITLSRFLRDYLYIPLGGNRDGVVRRYVNLFVTMLIGGLWHGAGWTFVAWGALHGVYLVINHLWRALRRRCGPPCGFGGRLGVFAARLLTLTVVAVAWVPFRAADLSSAGSMLWSMAGGNGIGLSAGLKAPVAALAPWAIPALGLDFEGTFPHELVYWPAGLPWMALLLVMVLTAPNSTQLLRRYDPVLPPERLSLATGAWAWPLWRPALGYALVTAGMMIWSLTWMTNVSEFLYFQF